MHSEMVRKGEEIWSRGLEHGYDNNNEFGNIANDLQEVIDLVESLPRIIFQLESGYECEAGCLIQNEAYHALKSFYDEDINQFRKCISRLPK